MQKKILFAVITMVASGRGEAGERLREALPRA